MASALPPLRRQRPATDSHLARPPATRMRLPTDPLQRIIKLVGAVEAVYAPHPVSAAPPPRASSTLPPLRNRAASPAVMLPAAPTPSSPRAVGKSKRLMLQHLEACFDSAEAAERTSVMLAEAQARTKLLSLCELPRESKSTPEQTRTPSPIRTRPGRVPARHIGKTRTATAYPVRRASVLEQHGRQAIEATEAKEWDWLVAVEKQARAQAEERSKLQRRTDTKQNRERDRKRCATAVVCDILEDAAATDDSRWELAQTLVHKSIASAMGKDAAEAALKAEKSSVDNQRHRYARALVDRLVASLVGRDPAPASRAA